MMRVVLQCDGCHAAFPEHELVHFRPEELATLGSEKGSAGKCPKCDKVLWRDRPSPAPVGSKVWVLRYTHRHGQDVYVHQTELACIKHAALLVKEWIGEVHDLNVVEQIETLLDGEYWSDVISVWSDYQSDRCCEPESLDWDDCLVEAHP